MEELNDYLVSSGTAVMASFLLCVPQTFTVSDVKEGRGQELLDELD